MECKEQIETRKRKKKRIEDYKIIKMKLNSIIDNKEVIDDINELVIRLHKLIIITYQFIEMYYLYNLENNKIIDIDKQFIKYCFTVLTIKEDNRGRKKKSTQLLEELKHFYDTQFKDVNPNKLESNNKLSDAPPPPELAYFNSRPQKS